MSVVIVVGGAETLDAAASHEAAAFGQGMTAQQQRDLERTIEQSTREQVQRAVEAAQQAASATRASQLAQPAPMPPLPPLPQAPVAPVAPGEPAAVVVTPEGRRIVIGNPRHPFATVTGKGDAQNVQFYAPNVPPEIVIIAVSFFIMLVFIAVGMPLARAFARRMDRQGARAEPSPFPTDVSDRIERIEQAVEAIAIEVERVSEGQRFTTKLLSEIRTPAALAEASQFTGEKR